MGKIIGLFLFLCGIGYLLYSWILEQKKQNKRILDMIVFVQKSLFVMEEERVQIVDYFQTYRGGGNILEDTLQEIARLLDQKIYPEGEMVWEAVFREKEQEWNLDEEIFDIILGLGKGFFGKKRSENVAFLRKGLLELEQQQKKKKERDAKERKVWIPVGMLGGMMFVIILI